MFTDIVGYTRKMGEDEVKMLKLLRDHNVIVKEIANKNEGEVVERIGDAFLVIFDSALNAVICATEIQQSLREYNKEKPESDQVHIRIGVHLGDIIIGEGEIFGDGVNVAARIEPLAHQDGICITRVVYDLIKKKMSFKAVELGPQQLKNVDEAVEVFHLLSDSVGVKDLRKAKRIKRIRSKSVLVMITGVIVVLIFFGLMSLDVIDSSRIKGILGLKEGLVIPENRVAVLPLRNLTGKIENQYLCDGMAENLIFRLSNIRDIHVHPLEDVMALGGELKTTKGLRKSLGATFLVKGSLQISNDSLVVQWDVFETREGKRLHSKRFHGLNTELAIIQEKSAREVLYQIVGRVTGEVEASLAGFASSNPTANDMYLQAKHAQRDAISWHDNKRVLRLYESVVEIDSLFALGRAELALAYLSMHQSWRKDTSWVEKMKLNAELAVALAPDLPEAHYCMGSIYAYENDYAMAENSYMRSIELRYNYQASLNALAGLYSVTGKFREALALSKRSLQLSKTMGNFESEIKNYDLLGMVYHNFGRYDQAIEQYNKSRDIYKEIGNRRYEALSLQKIAASYYNSGKPEKALDYHIQSKEIFRELNFQRAEAGELRFISSTYCMMREYDKALDNSKASLSIYIGLGDRMGKAAALSSIAYAYRFSNQFDSALVYSEKGLVAYREIGDSGGEASCLEECAYINEEMKNYKLALKLYEQSLQVGRKVGSWGISTLLSIGRVNVYLGMYDLAIKQYQDCLDKVREGDSRKMEIRILRQLASVYEDINEYALAHDRYLEAYTHLNKSDRPRRRLELKADIGVTLYYQKLYHAAIDTFESVVNQEKSDVWKYGRTPKASFYLDACNVRAGNVDDGLIGMISELGGLLLSDRLKANRELVRVLIDLDRLDDAKLYLTEGRGLADTTGMKGEVKKFDELLSMLSGN